LHVAVSARGASVCGRIYASSEDYIHARSVGGICPQIIDESSTARDIRICHTLTAQGA